MRRTTSAWQLSWFVLLSKQLNAKIDVRKFASGILLREEKVIVQQSLVEQMFERLLDLWFLANVNSRSRSLYVVVRPSICRLSSVVCRLSVTFVHPT